MSGKPGRSGRKPKTALVKKLEGNRRKLGKAKLHDDLAVEGAPQLPPYFDTVHTALWRETLKALPAGLLHRADTGCLERFVVAWTQFRSVTRKILDTGELVRGETGPVRNPLLAVQKAAAAMMDRAGADLGLSPAARARIGNPVNSEEDPMALLLGGDPDDPWSTTPWTRQ
jgi:P27 family predicted phage terminase small subunit